MDCYGCGDTIYEISAVKVGTRGADPGARYENRMEGIMRIRRAILPAILALGLAGSVVAGSAMPVVAGAAPGARAQVVAGTYYHN